METINLKLAMLHFRRFVIRLLAVLSYSFIGAAVFYSIEQSDEKHHEIRTNFTSVISSIKWRLNDNTSSAELHQLSRDLYQLADDITDMRHEKMNDADRYFTWVYFCLTTIMTIGYGDITPKTRNGRLFLIFYGAPGIALMIILLTFCAQFQTLIIQVLVKKINKRRRKTDKNCGSSKNEDILVFIFSVLFLIPVEIIGVMLVWRRTNWPAIDCLYFWFCTVTTIGFGDLIVPYGKAGNILPWLLMKTLTLATMAGVVNSLAVVLQKRKKIKLRRHKKRSSHVINEIELN